MLFSDKKQIHKLLEEIFNPKIAGIIQDYLYPRIKIKLPTSINGATINVSKILSEDNSVQITYGNENFHSYIVLEMKNIHIFPFIEYIGKSQKISVMRNISGKKKFKILKDILGYNFNINVEDFDIDQIKISMNGLVKYSIFLNALSIDEIPIDKRKKIKKSRSYDGFVYITDENENPRNEKRNRYYGNIIKSICSVEVKNSGEKIMFECNRDREYIYISGYVMQKN